MDDLVIKITKKTCKMDDIRDGDLFVLDGALYQRATHHYNDMSGIACRAIFGGTTHDGTSRASLCYFRRDRKVQRARILHSKTLKQ